MAIPLALGAVFVHGLKAIAGGRGIWYNGGMNVVSLVGRPNTGKSALFNRIAKKRLAIVFDQPGVTRDRVTREVEVAGRKVMLVDTGGIAFDRAVTHDPLDEETRSQAAMAVEDSAICVIVVDAREGIMPLDAEVITRVRESGTPCIIAANKCDTPDDDWKAHEFERFGLKVFAVSAEHGRGTQALIEEIVSKLPLPGKDEDEDAKRPLRVAVVGRPNAGKSSYINRLLNAQRVIVSDIPGTTRDAVEVPFSIGSGPDARKYMLVDTAGMKPHTKMSKTSVDNFSLFRSEQAIAEADVVLIVMEASLGPTMQDKRIAGKVLEANKACVILMNKWDLAQKNDVSEKKAGEAMRQMLPFLNFAPIVFCSAKSGYNIRKSVDAIDRAATSASIRLPTGMLNRTIEQAAKKTLSPMVRGKRLKIYYALQVSTNPQTIRLFVNDPKLATDQYLSYMEKAIRARFGLEGAPLRIFMKARPRGVGAGAAGASRNNDAAL